MHTPLASSLYVPCAQTLTIANNQLETAEDIRAVADLPALACLDLKGNIIDDPAVLDVLAAMPSLRVLYLQGNPVVKRIRHYRKTVISRLEGLRFLDDRPVFDEERERVTAWAAGMKAGGSKEAAARERATIAAQKQRAREADERNFRAFEAMVRSHAAPGETEARTEAYLESAEAATAVATAAEREARGPEGALPWETTPLPAEAFVQASRAAEAAGAAAASAAAGAGGAAAGAGGAAAGAGGAAAGAGGAAAPTPTSRPGVMTESKTADSPPLSAAVPAPLGAVAPLAGAADGEPPAATSGPGTLRAGADVEAEHVLEPCRSGSEAAVRAYSQAPAGIGRRAFLETAAGRRAGAGGSSTADAASAAESVASSGPLPDMPESEFLRAAREERLRDVIRGDKAHLDPARDAAKWDADSGAGAGAGAVTGAGAAASAGGAAASAGGAAASAGGAAGPSGAVPAAAAPSSGPMPAHAAASAAVSPADDDIEMMD